MKSILKSYKDETVIKIDCCVNNCVAFWDADRPELSRYKYAHLMVCPNPLCREPRYIMNNRRRMSRNHFFYFPLAKYFESLFKMTDIVPLISNDLDPSLYAPGHLRRSRGWKQKVTDNPNIACDSRHQSIILSTDGVPYFKNFNLRSGWPVVIRSGGLPDGLWNDMFYAHMVALQPTDYWTMEEGECVRKKRYYIRDPLFKL